MAPERHTPPLLGFAAWSGTGKTTLLVSLLPLLREQGLRIAVIKHAHHEFDIDKPGKDSYELRKAGAEQMLIASSRRWALMTENPTEAEPEIETLIDKLDPERYDLILVEGFKQAAIPKIELHRAVVGKPLFFPQDPNIIAVATDAPLTETTELPVLDINAPADIAAFIIRNLINR
ncbi:MAG: molybdopterin-guanine dinucleotide biosynthesis protein MobB [Gammaproteobacteria bacterium]|jgi:molybdopterin-guanine dinucleotide biosynthesis adapter protein